MSTAGDRRAADQGSASALGGQRAAGGRIIYARLADDGCERKEPSRADLRGRITKVFQKRVGNPLNATPAHPDVLETTGRKSGRPRRTPLGGSRVGAQFWLVSEFGEKSQYVQNITANRNVRVRLGGRWHSGTAHLMPDDDPRERLRPLPQLNSLAVRAMGTNLLRSRVDLTD